MYHKHQTDSGDFECLHFLFFFYTQAPLENVQENIFACRVWVLTVCSIVVLFRVCLLSQHVAFLLILQLADLNHRSCVSDSCMSDRPVKDVVCGV